MAGDFYISRNHWTVNSETFPKFHISNATVLLPALRKELNITTCDDGCKSISKYDTHTILDWLRTH